MLSRLKARLVAWLTTDGPPRPFPLVDFERIKYELRPGDIVLVEGRTRVADVIKMITQSPWSHAMLYVGRVHDVEDPAVRARLKQFSSGQDEEQLVIEGILGQGTIVTRLEEYRHDHLRICRPSGISRHDAQRVCNYAIGHLGDDYNVRQLLDLMRFMMPWGFLPRRWRSSLFVQHAGDSTRTVCSTMLAEAFNTVKYPILPIIKAHQDTGIQLIKRNPRLYTPRDFDYSPYFDVLKFPFVGDMSRERYRHLPWGGDNLLGNDEHDIMEMPSPPIELPKVGKTAT
ncbi:MAG: hypothetical protein HYV16_10250 [Gammaproteobacteria bacterium]|nr:hypothetical protein [Gammaproteobacteria bacterium]